MKWKDIPQFVRDGSYCVDQPLDHLQHVLDRYAGMGLQMEPDFQRGHVWTDKQSSRYMEFLLRGGQSNRIIYFNFPGWMNSYEGDFVLVDGLQRLTACLRFLKNELPAFGLLFNEFEGRFPMTLTLRFNVNTLKTRAEVLQWYLDMNSGGVVHTTAELDKVRALLAAEYA